MQEFRVFKQISIQEYEEWQQKLKGQSRIDLYVTGLPLNYGLKFRNIEIGKKNYKCRKLELKQLEGTVWKKIIQYKGDKKIKIKYQGAEFEKESMMQCFQAILDIIPIKDLAFQITTNLNNLNLLPLEKLQQKQYGEEISLIRLKNTYYLSLEIEGYTEYQLKQKMVQWAQLLKCENIFTECIIGSYPDFIQKIL